MAPISQELHYEVKFISKDNHTFIFNAYAISEMDAVANVETRIVENGWTHHCYVLDRVEKHD